MGSLQFPDFLGAEGARGGFFLPAPFPFLSPPPGFAAAWSGERFFPEILLDFLLLSLPQGLVGEVTLLEKSSREGSGLAAPWGGPGSSEGEEDDEEELGAAPEFFLGLPRQPRAAEIPRVKLLGSPR